MAIWVWEADTSEVLHRFDNQFLARASAPEDMRDDLQTALEMLFKSGGCLARAADVSSKIVKVLEYLAEAGLVTSPPWTFTEAGHARILQCVSLQNSQKLLGRSDRVSIGAGVGSFGLEA